MHLGTLSLGDLRPDPRTGECVSQADRHRAIVDNAVLAGQLGFALTGVGEHHFNDYIVSSPHVVLSAIAARTQRIRLMTTLTLLAMLDPVHVAEDFATLDQLSDGRVELVIGRGINPESYRSFGLDADRSREMLVEKLELLQALWADAQPVSWSGQFRAPLDGITVQPRPFQSGGPRIWMGTGLSEESVRQTAELGLPLMLPSIFRAAETFRPMVELYRLVMAANGRAEQAVVGLVSHLHVAPTSQGARATWAPYLTEYVRWGRGMRGVVDPVDFDELASGPALCGSPGEVTDRMLAAKEAVDPDVYFTVFDIGGLPQAEVIGSMELFAAEVMPKVQAG
jgi:alkanesulfonate monooxygenase SsuD/methylene tetrahydromethanopterin reductase-like flavin-dependent oxidoreductase (luciferase family)